MIAGWFHVDAWWTSIVGERFVGDQEQFFEQDQQEQQEYFENQGKYSFRIC